MPFFPVLDGGRCVALLRRPDLEKLMRKRGTAASSDLLEAPLSRSRNSGTHVALRRKDAAEMKVRCVDVLQRVFKCDAMF